MMYPDLFKGLGLKNEDLSKDVEAVRQEVKWLKEAGAIKEVFFPKWLASTVVVKKKNDK